MSRAGRIFIKPYLSTADRHVEAILLKEYKALFDDGAVHKWVKIRKTAGLFVGSKVVGKVKGSTYVSHPLESESHTTASPALQQETPLSENSFLLQVSTLSHEDSHFVLPGSPVLPSSLPSTLSSL